MHNVKYQLLVELERKTSGLRSSPSRPATHGPVPRKSNRGKGETINIWKSQMSIAYYKISWYKISRYKIPWLSYDRIKTIHVQV